LTSCQRPRESGPSFQCSIAEWQTSGQEFSWGRVVVWEPAGWLVCEWLVGDTPTELEVRFAGGYA
jgi:hypothetical protein